MPVPTYPSAIAGSNIQTEFGGANPISLAEYYSGGAYVSSGSANSTGTVIPVSGQVSYLNYSGASAVVPKYFWYDRLYPDSGTIYYNESAKVSNLRNSTNSYAVLHVTNPAPVIQRNDGTYANTNWAYDITFGGGTYATGTPTDISTANNDTIYAVIHGTRILSVSGTGTKNWSTNTSNTVYATAGLNGGVYFIGRGAVNNSWLANVSTSDGTTINSYFGFRLSTFTWMTGKCLAKSPTENVVALIGRTGSGPAAFTFWTGNNTFYRGASFNSISAFGDFMTDAKVTNYLGILPFRFATNKTEFGTLDMLQGAGNSVSGVRKVPTGNGCVYITNTEDATIYDDYFIYVAFTVDYSTTWLMKLSGNFNVTSWTRTFASARSDQESGPVIESLVATKNSLLFHINIRQRVFNSKYNSWTLGGILESHIIRLPIDGSKTGTRANLRYSSVTSPSLSTNTAYTATANSPPNTAYTFSFASNTTTLIANSQYNINGTAI